MIRFDDTLWLFTIEEYNQLPDGIELFCIDGTTHKKGDPGIDMDTRFGHLAFGVIDPKNHPESELFTKFMLMQ